ncbi:MAG: glycosyltransferase family 2 protein [Patescibacteria group bacterium]
MHISSNKNARKRDKILVCVPSYNAEESIVVTIQSVLNQSIKNYKILVVDNCSTDRTAGIVENMRRVNDNSEKIEFVANPLNLGRIQNWNKCIELFLLSDFDYLKFLFTGDTLQKAGLEILLNGFNKYDDKLGIVVAGYRATEKDLVKKVQTFSEEKYLTPRDGLMLFVKNGNWVGAPLSCMFSKNAVSGIRFNESFDFTSDYMFYINLASNNDALCIDENIGNFSLLQRKHLQKYKASLFAKIEEIHARYFALARLKKHLSDLEEKALTSYLNKDSAKIIIFHTSFLDSVDIFLYKIKMSFSSVWRRVR